MNDLLRVDNINKYPTPSNEEWKKHLESTQELVDYLPGTTCRIWYTHLSICYPEHWHNALEIIVGERAHYDVVIEGTAYEVHKGDILIVPPGVTHTLSPQRGCNGFVYLIDLGILNQVKSAYFVMPFLSKAIFITEKGNPKLHIIAGNLLDQMKKEYFSGDNTKEFLIYSHMFTLAAEIGRNHFDAQENSLHIRPDKCKEYIDMFNEILYFINNNYMEELTIEQLSVQYNLSKYHFARLFKQYTQYTFCDYLTHRRIKASEHLLSEPDMSITDIAYHIGFSSVSTFSRVFKQQHNCTPSEYRKISSSAIQSVQLG